MNSQPIDLTPEQEFALLSFNVATKDLDRESAINMLQDIYRQAFINEIRTRRIFGEMVLSRQWPIV
jgi:Phycobilisome degradation protein nblA